MFGWLGRGVVRHPWWTIGAWLVAAAVLVVFAPKLTTKSDQQAFLPKKYESVAASNLAEKAFPSGDQKVDREMVVVKRSDGGTLSAADQQKIGQTAKAIQAKAIPNVQMAATSPQTLSQNHKVQLIVVGLPNGFDTKTQKKNEDAIKQVRAVTADQLKGSGLAYGVAGNFASSVDNEKSSQRTLALIGLATVVLIIALILIIFRSPIAALLPIIVIVLVSQVANAVTAFIGKAFDLSFDDGFSTIIVVVLYGIGTDYILFLLFRYRERLRAGEDKKTAMITSVERVGEAIASAAGAVIAAFIVLVLASFKAFGALGPQLAIAVAVMFITALTLVPAIVSLLGRFVFWPSKAWKKEPKPGLWVKIGNSVGRRPAVTAIASGLVLVALAAGALAFKADYDFQAGSPQNTESAKAMKDLQASLPSGLTSPTEVYVQGSGPLDKSAVQKFQQTLATAKGVGQVAPAQYSPDQSVAKITVVLKLNPSSNEAISLVKGPFRDLAHQNAPPGTKAMVGGMTAAYADINEVNNRDLSVIIPVAVLLIGIILALLLRALVAPIYLVIAVLLGFTATLGATVALFQGIEGKEGLMFQLPIILYLFVLAIGTDYNILMIARLREESREGHDPRRAAALGIQHAGPTVAAAGVILAGTFAALTLSPQSMLAEIGFGVAIGILLSAFVMSALFVPSITALMGHKAWWPGHGDAARKGNQPPAAEPYDLVDRPV
ncbi:MMPL family transporter [Actinoallomurus rhizosphaericola]|uniref:MMPL family transporter n=1 Tax=Actinoallomurus rhizosphaericola TaxID=2952536 RepID=UPI0020912F3B|nr:MMPL family transporter [Actinoallomurus rhizosphaericola]MCO5992757.1 MMPL family transporter [Actinoallomurus rhizosphaericola]